MFSLSNLRSATSANSLSTFLPVEAVADNVLAMGGRMYCAYAISNKLNAIVLGQECYIHGSNSNSLDTFARDGYLLPRSKLTERQIRCDSGECTQPQFMGAYGNSGHNSVFAYKYSGGHISIVEASKYANYNTGKSDEDLFPVIYVLDIKSNFTATQYGEYFSDENGISPDNIVGILVPGDKVERVKSMVVDYPSLKIESFE